MIEKAKATVSKSCSPSDVECLQTMNLESCTYRELPPEFTFISELCQAYILMSIYAVPARRWEEDRSWLYTGLAIRIATDLNLHMYSTRRARNDTEARELINRTRVWMICFNLDRSTATQFGKPATIKEDLFVSGMLSSEFRETDGRPRHSINRNADDWYKRSKYNHPVRKHSLPVSYARLTILHISMIFIFADTLLFYVSLLGFMKAFIPI